MGSLLDELFPKEASAAWREERIKAIAIAAIADEASLNFIRRLTGLDDDRIRQIAFAYTLVQAFKVAREEGREEGRKEGIEIGHRAVNEKVVRKECISDSAVDLIHETTGLDVETIKDLSVSVGK